jgi:hypothetical protein
MIRRCAAGLSAYASNRDNAVIFEVAVMTKTKPKPKWISIPQAARELDCSHSRIRRILAAGQVSVLRVPGTQPRVSTRDLARFVKSSTSAFRASAA